MKIGFNFGYWGARPPDRFIELAQRAEALGFDIVCCAEAYGSDVFVPLAAIASHTRSVRLGTAIMQISARTPAAAAMAAITLDHLSGGRLCLGVGVSGPQVVEGWYGQPFRKPLERTREWLEIFRRILARDEPVTFAGQQYQLPYTGPGSTGQGKPLMSIVHPLRRHIPVFLGAEGPKNIALAAEQFDGWYPIFAPPDKLAMFQENLAGAKPGFEILPTLPMVLADDLGRALMPVKQNIALYVGGMGSKDENFHKRFVERLGYADAAQEIQDLWLSGRQKEAVLAVPDELADAVCLIGPQDHVRGKLRAWKHSIATTLMIGAVPDFDANVRHMEFLAREML